MPEQPGQPLAQRVIDLTGTESMLYRSAVQPRHEDTFRQLMRRGYPGHGAIVEVGTFWGVSTVLLCDYAEHVITLDPAKRPQKYDIWKHFGVADKIEYRKGGVELLTPDEEYTMAFVDGDHSRESVERDFEAVRGCGRVLFHDYCDTFKGVRDAVNGIKGGLLCVAKPFALWLSDEVWHNA